MKNVNIPEPCSEDWSKMTPSDKGAFCKKCALDVYDFTNKSSDEIREILTVNIGARVCGHIHKAQLDQLNSDFSSWQMNDKQTFQRAWVFTLFVVFGMTLFSCNSDEEPIVDEFQKVGNEILTAADSTDKEELYPVTGAMCVPEDTTSRHIKDVGVKSLNFHPAMKGQISYQEYLPYSQEEEQPIDPPEDDQDYLIDGGMMLSSHFDEYLLDTAEDRFSKDPIAHSEIKGLVYPNPASNQTKLKLTIPNTGKGEIELIALNGQKIKTIHSGKLKKGGSEFPIDLTDIETGVYLVIIQLGKKKETIKLTKV